MNRLFSLLLSLLFLFAGTSCVGRAAPAESDVAKVSSQTVSSSPPPTPSEPLEQADDTPKEPEQVEAPEEPYVRVVDPSKPMVALTFDDGPHAVYTNQILDALEANHAVATFFEVGRNVAAVPEVLPRMEELGCEIASHSNAHKNLSKMKKAALLKDLDTADQAFIAAVGSAPTLVRPPYGAVNKTVKSASGRTMITWTVDTLDWKSKDAQTVVDYLQNYGDLDGEIVLMHSIYESTAQAVETLLPWLHEQGYQTVTVTELMAYYYGELLQPNQFYGYTYFTTHGRTDTPAQLSDEEAAAPAEQPASPTAEPQSADSSASGSTGGSAEQSEPTAQPSAAEAAPETPGDAAVSEPPAWLFPN